LVLYGVHNSRAQNRITFQRYRFLDISADVENELNYDFPEMCFLIASIPIGAF